MIRVVVLLILLLPMLCGCASLIKSLADGHYVTEEGKESPFKPVPNQYEPPKDPTSRF